MVAGACCPPRAPRPLLVPGVPQLPGGHRRLPDGWPARSVAGSLLGEVRKQRTALHLYALRRARVRALWTAPRHLVPPVRVGGHEHRRSRGAHLPVDPDRGSETPAQAGGAVGAAVAPPGTRAEPGVHHRRSRPDQSCSLPPHHLGPGDGSQDRLTHIAARDGDRARCGDKAHSAHLRAVPASSRVVREEPSTPSSRSSHARRSPSSSPPATHGPIGQGTSSTPSAPVRCSTRATRICRAFCRGCITVPSPLWCSCRHWW